MINFRNLLDTAIALRVLEMAFKAFKFENFTTQKQSLRDRLSGSMVSV